MKWVIETKISSVFRKELPLFKNLSETNVFNQPILLKQMYLTNLFWLFAAEHPSYYPSESVDGPWNRKYLRDFKWNFK